jgi:hypothetical protein
MRRSRDSFAKVKSDGRSSEMSFWTVATQRDAISQSFLNEGKETTLLFGRVLPFGSERSSSTSAPPCMGIVDCGSSTEFVRLETLFFHYLRKYVEFCELGSGGLVRERQPLAGDQSDLIGGMLQIPLLLCWAFRFTTYNLCLTTDRHKQAS